MSNKYNGWANYQTWNVALWINNDESLYHAAVKFMRPYTGRTPYRSFIASMGLSNKRTPDGAPWCSSVLSYRELNAMMWEFKPGRR